MNTIPWLGFYRTLTWVLLRVIIKTIISIQFCLSIEPVSICISNYNCYDF